VTRRHISVVPAVPSDDAGDWLRTATPQRDGTVLLHLAAEAEDLPRLASVIDATERRGAFEQLLLDAGAGPGIEAQLAPLGAQVRVATCVTGHPEVPEDLDAALNECRPTAVVIHVDDLAGLCGAIAAARRGISIVRVGAVPTTATGRAIVRLADVLLTRSAADALELPISLTGERATVIGNPLVDVVQRNARAALDAAAWRRCGVAPGGYVLAVLTGRVPLALVRSTIHGLAARQPVILEAPSRWTLPAAHRFVHLSFLERLSLERTATSIVTDSTRVCEEAGVLGVPCHHVAADGLVSDTGEGNESRGAAAWDGRAGERAADALVANFARLRLATEAF
jgi:hypothetical protein